MTGEYMDYYALLARLDSILESQQAMLKMLEPTADDAEGMDWIEAHYVRRAE